MRNQHSSELSVAYQYIIYFTFIWMIGQCPSLHFASFFSRFVGFLLSLFRLGILLKVVKLFCSYVSDWLMLYCDLSLWRLIQYRPYSTISRRLSLHFALFFVVWLPRLALSCRLFLLWFFLLSSSPVLLCYFLLGWGMTTGPHFLSAHIAWWLFRFKSPVQLNGVQDKSGVEAFQPLESSESYEQKRKVSSKVGDLSRGRPEGSLFNSYYTDV